MSSALSDAPIFIGGSGRSGTTLLRVILDSHPRIVCGPELKVVPVVCQMWYEFRSVHFPALREHHLTTADVTRSFADLMLSLLEKDRTVTGKQRVAEKSPHNVFYFPHLHTLFPQSPLIHVIRDGRDVVCSLLSIDQWLDPKTMQPVDFTRDARKAAAYWVRAVTAGQAAQRQLPSLGARYYELRYEQLVTAPETTLRALFAFLCEPWHAEVLQFHQQSRNLAGESSAAQVSVALNSKGLARWKTDLREADKDAVKEVAGPLLMQLGYATDQNW